MIPVLLLKILKNINSLFKDNLSTLNLDKMCFMQFLTKNSNIMNMPIIYVNSQIAISTDIQFLGLIIDKAVSGKDTLTGSYPNGARLSMQLGTLNPICH
jgi:hypothetical protein